MIRRIKRNKLKSERSKKNVYRPNKIGKIWRLGMIKLKGEIPWLIEYKKTNKVYSIGLDEIYYYKVREV